MIINLKSILYFFVIIKNIFYLMFCIFLVIPLFVHADEVEDSIKIVIPSKKDGGLDYTGRLLGEFLSDEKIIKNVTFENIPGSGGGRGVEEFLKMDPKKNAVLISSLGILVADTDGSLSKDKEILAKMIPIFVITEDYAIIAVDYSSSYKDLDGLLREMKREPIKFKIFGGSKDKGLDHLNFLIAAKKFKIDPQNIQYVSSSGGGEAYQKFLNSTNGVLSTSFSENIKYIVDKKIKVLALCSKSKLKTFPDVPTFKEANIPDCLINYRIVYVNKNSTSSKLEFYQNIFNKIILHKNWNEFSKDNHIVNIDMKRKNISEFIEERKENIKSIISSIEKK